MLDEVDAFVAGVGGKELVAPTLEGGGRRACCRSVCMLFFLVFLVV